MRLTQVACGAVLLLAVGRAPAGDFCGSLDGPAALRELERYADGKGGRVHPDCFEQSYGRPLPDAVRARIVAACARAVVLPVPRRSGSLDAWCRLEVLWSGRGKVGDRDLVGELLAGSTRWDAWPAYEALAATGDDRVRPTMLARFAADREAWRETKRAAWAREAWESHERQVLGALARVGTEEDLALIDEIGAERPTDGRTAQAAARARDAIRARRR